MFDLVWQWLLTPIDTSVPHIIDFQTAWHGRLMVGAWGLLFPVSILITRFMKITPGQKWPEQLDNRFWFKVHVTAQLAGGVAMAVAVWLIWSEGSDKTMHWLHRMCGWSVVTLYVAQVVGGAVRGSRGGPEWPAPDGSWHGDHYDMTRRRVIFEIAHKSLGYLSLALAFVAMVLGLWISTAPHWMWLGLFGWWGLAAIIYAACQKRGMALDTYQAIWGPDPSLPGNCRKPIGIGIRRYPG